MKLLVDEHIPRMTVQALVDMGHDVLDIRGSELEGLPDNELWDLAQSQQRVLVSADKGFTKYRQSVHFGILIVRLRRPNRHNIHTRIIQAINQFEETEWGNLLVTMRDVAQSVARFRSDQ